MQIFFQCCALSALCLILGCHSAYRTTARELGYPDAERTVVDGKVHLVLPSQHLPHDFQFTIGQRPAMIDGVSYYLNRPAGTRDLSRDDIRLLRNALLRPYRAKAKLNLLLDPGHGGTDSGCRRCDVYEQKIALAITREVQAILKSHGHNVNLTRPDETTTRSLDERTQLGASLKIDAFVSVHVNASANPEAKGVETYTLPAFGCDGSLPNSPARGALVGHAYLITSTRLAFYVQQALLGKGKVGQSLAPADRGVRHAHFKVLRDTPAPSILIETGFITNDEDFARITDPAQQKVIAQQIATGILTAFGH
jgi:N-acetylmuramoyl-L-alanine amidase